MSVPRTLFLPTNGPAVNWWRMILFFKNMVKNKLDMALYGYEPNNNNIAKWENLFDSDKLGTGVRDEIYGLMRWSEVAVIGFAHYPSTIALIEGFRSKIPAEQDNIRGTKKIVCDIDDFVLDTPEYNPAFKAGWKPGGMYGWVPGEHLKMADLVINSTDWLCDQHKKFNKNCIVIPNSIDEEWWNVKKPEKKRKNIRIGWVGGSNHDEDFRVMPRVIEQILDRYKNVEFYLVHGAPPYMRKLNGRVRCTKAWSTIEAYPKFLAKQDFDIGIAPLDQNRFNMGKSNIKWLEYSILGIPGVFSDTEPYKAINDGVDGFRAIKIADWVDRLSQLIESEELRVKMGEEARRRVIKDFNIKDTSNRYMEALRSLK